jgi:hypothetical protein
LLDGRCYGLKNIASSIRRVTLLLIGWCAGNEKGRPENRAACMWPKAPDGESGDNNKAPYGDEDARAHGRGASGAAAIAKESGPSH